MQECLALGLFLLTYKIMKYISFLAALIILTGSSGLGANDPDVSRYDYQQTRDLVRFVHAAADLLEEKGEKAFDEFRDVKGKWFSQRKYIFAYDTSGVCVCHPDIQELEGRDFSSMKDLDGKTVIKDLIFTATQDETPYGWLHYLWMEPGDIFPVKKSSYVVKATAPDGKVYVVGSGIYNMREERAFIEETVDAAVDLINKDGVKAFQEIQKRSSKFVYGNTYVFVLTDDGKLVVDPAFPSDEYATGIKKGRNLFDFKDAVGKYVVREIIEKLKSDDSVWVMYMWPRIGENKPSKKVVYARKVRIRDRVYIVGSDIFLANPIWMKM